MTKDTIYQPSKHIGERLKRKLRPFLARQPIHFEISKPIISISFDDFPRSVMENALPQLDIHNWKSTFYVSGGLEGISNHFGPHFTKEDIKKLWAEGHEIGRHTFSHIDLSNTSDEEMKRDIRRNRDYLEDLGVYTASENFAYPYGTFRTSQKQALGRKFQTLRGIHPYTHHRVMDISRLGAYPLYSGEPHKKLIKAITRLKTRPGWLILFTHDVCKTPSPWGCTPEEFHLTLEAIKQSGADIMPVKQAYTSILEQQNVNMVLTNAT